MIRIKQKITAVFTAAVLVFSMSSTAFAEFVDPGKNYFNDKSDSDVIDNDDEEAVDDYVTDEPEEDTQIKTIEIYDYKSVAYVGDTFKIGYNIEPSNSTDRIFYSTSNSKIAKIDSSATVTALKRGTVTITVKSENGVKDRFKLTVKETPENSDDTQSDNFTGEQTDSNTDNGSSDDEYIEATSIQLQHSTVSLYVGDTYRIKYSLTPSNSNDTIKFSSQKSSVASVDSSGVITANSAGEARIYCKAGSGAFKKVLVIVMPGENDKPSDEDIENSIDKEYDDKGNLVPSEVRFGAESVSVRVGETVNLDARVYPAGAKYTYTIKSDNSSVAKVNSFGVITGVKAGNAIITLTTDNGKSDEIYVTVYGDVIPGIDVSKWNGKINWKKVKNSGKAGFAMIRASYGYEDTDEMLAENVAGCEKYDIPYGFYHYTYARNVSEAKKEAAYFLSVIKRYSPTYPVVLDIEEDFYKQMSKKEVTAIVTTFMEAVESAGYYAMIYSYAKFFDDNLLMDKIDKYDIWVACWGSHEELNENYGYHYGIWQYSETGKLPGIDEFVDLNYSYKDYESTIKKYGLNNSR